VTIVFYVSGHGFGHASREIEVMHALAERRSDLEIIVRTSVPASFFAMSARVPLEVQNASVDPGVAQIDSIRIDETATARQAVEFYGSFAGRVEAEARGLVAAGAQLVVGDVPPLAFAAAARAGIPSVLIANFTWDWIYDRYDHLASARTDIFKVIRQAQREATTALRLPFHGGFGGICPLTDIPLIARVSRRARFETRRLLGLPRSTPIVLASFGRYGVALPLERLASDTRFIVVLTEHDSQSRTRRDRSPLCLSRDDLTGSGLRYEDLVAAADVVVSKPGYGIVSECIANGAALLYTSRANFIEQEILLREMPDALRCRPIATDRFLEGHWWDDIEALLQQPAPLVRPDVHGASVAADAILSLASKAPPASRGRS
jgi:L-arabinokinase